MAEDKKQLSLQDIIREEYKKCLMSPVYFMRHYVKVQNIKYGTVLFNLYNFQEKALNDFNTYNNNIILKSRQMGISTLVAAYSLWLCIFNKDQNILIISLKEIDAMDVLEKVSFANQNLPTWLKLQLIENNKKSIKFSNGSQVRAASTTKKSGVGKSLHLLILDECGLIDEAESLWSSASPALSTGGKSILLSTPRGVGSFFHKMWVDAEESNINGIGKNGFHPIKLPWNLHPERDDEWRRIEGEKQPNPKQAAREFDCDFETSGETVIEQSLINFYKKTYQQDPIERRGFGGLTWIWKYPNYNNSYILSADSALGNGGDFSAAHIIDIATMEQCMEFKGQLNPKEFGNLLVSLATEYNNALIVPERENMGYATAQAIIDRGYPNLFYASSDLKYVDVHRQLTNKYYSDEKKLLPGFSTNLKTRPLMISHFEQNMREKNLKIFSSRLLSELDTFIWKNNKAQAMQGYNDDLCVLENTWIRTINGIKMIKDIEVGEYVLTHKGRYKRVTKKFISEKDEYNIVSSIGKMDLGITKNHPLLIFNKLKNKESEYYKSGSWNKVSPNSSFISIEKLNTIKNKYLSSVIPIQEINNIEKIDLWKYANDNHCLNGENEIISLIIDELAVKINPRSNPISRYINIDEDFCFLMGYYLAEGSKSKDGIGFASHKNENKIRDYIKNILTKYGFNPFEFYSKNNMGCILHIQSVILYKFFNEFGKSTNKHLPNEFMNLPNDKLIYILSGYLAGDGSFYRNSIKSVTISPHLAFQMYEIASKCGIISTIKGLTNEYAMIKECNFNGKISNCLIQPTIRLGFNLIDHRAITLLSTLREKENINQDIRGERIKIYNNFILGELYSIKNIKLMNKIKFYNLEVEDDNSYTANGIVVHNCMAFCIGLWVRDTALRLRQEGVELVKTTLGHINKTQSDQIPVYKSKQMEIGKNAWQMPTGRTGYGKQNMENLEWLIK